MQLLRSLIFTIFFFASTLIYAFAVLALGWLPHERLYGVARSWARTNLAVLEVLCGLGYVVEGREHIPAGNHVAMWKHSSAWETIAQAIVFPAQAWVLKRELMWIPILGWAVHLMKPIAIDRSARSAAVARVLAQGRERIRDGLWILIFPEGTRVAAGQTRRYGVSGALLALQNDRLIVPVAHNAGYFWPRRGWIKKPGRIRVVIGRPIDPAGRDAREINQEVQAWIEATVAAIAPQGRSTV